MDSRFQAIETAPIYRKGKSGSRNNKVKLDERFKAVFTEEKFRSAPGKIDKYGRKSTKGEENASKELSAFYDFEEESGHEAEIRIKAIKSKGSSKIIESRLDYLNKMARGEISEDEEEEGDSDHDVQEADDDDEGNVAVDYEDGDVDIVHTAAAPMKGALDVPGDEIISGEATSRLAIQNCDWENIKAEDILVVLQSFCPVGRSIVSVTVYPSDFGLERMAREARYGPHGLWDNDNGEFVDEAEAADDEDLDLEDDGGEEDLAEKKRKGDFSRKEGHVGVVMHDAIVVSAKAQKKAYNIEDNDEDHIDDPEDKNKVSLRAYELSKLRYFFAVAVCDTVTTADSLYSQLDGVEMEHSSMVFDLRFVPDEISFTDRQVRDSCSNSSFAIDRYKPPDFVVQALQHTNLECSWDLGERERERKLTNISLWRQLQDSDLQQYIASSDSDDESDENEDKEGYSEGISRDQDDDGRNNKGRADRTARLRKLLLGDAADDDEDNDFDGNDDFFASVDNEVDDEEDKADHDDIAGNRVGRQNAIEKPAPGEFTYTYTPEGDGEKHSEADSLDKLTPFEALKRKMAERKKARKQAKKESKAIAEETKVANTVAATSNHSKKGKAATTDSSQQAKHSEAAEEEEDEIMERGDFNMRTLLQEEKLKSKNVKSKNKRKKLADLASINDGSQHFDVDLHDSRFQALLAGDARFGIDVTAPEFKETAGMKKILSEQRKQHSSRDSDMASSQHARGDYVASADEGEGVEGTVNSDVSRLAEKLKRKFGNVNVKTPTAREESISQQKSKKGK